MKKITSLTDRQAARRGERGTEALVAAAAAGEPLAWNQLIDRYAVLIRSVCRSHRLCDADTDDVAQLTWLRAVEHIGRLRDPDRFGAWIATTARHECLAVLRGRKRVVPTADEVPQPLFADHVDPDEIELAAERRDGGARTRWPRCRTASGRCCACCTASPRPATTRSARRWGCRSGASGRPAAGRSSGCAENSSTHPAPPHRVGSHEHGRPGRRRRSLPLGRRLPGDAVPRRASSGGSTTPAGSSASTASRASRAARSPRAPSRSRGRGWPTEGLEAAFVAPVRALAGRTVDQSSVIVGALTPDSDLRARVEGLPQAPVRRRHAAGPAGPPALRDQRDERAVRRAVPLLQALHGRLPRRPRRPPAGRARRRGRGLLGVPARPLPVRARPARRDLGRRGGQRPRPRRVPRARGAHRRRRLRQPRPRDGLEGVPDAARLRRRRPDGRPSPTPTTTGAATCSACSA